MLVLSRRDGERILIGDRITVTVLESRDGQIRLGVDCPREIPVHRFEVYERIRREAGRECASV